MSAGQLGGPATGHLDIDFLGFPLSLNKPWDDSQISSYYCILLMQPSRFKSIQIYYLLWSPLNYLFKFPNCFLLTTLTVSPPRNLVARQTSVGLNLPMGLWMTHKNDTRDHCFNLNQHHCFSNLRLLELWKTSNGPIKWKSNNVAGINSTPHASKVSSELAA